MPYYCTTHKDEDLNALKGELLDATTNHMVLDSGYSLADMLAAAGTRKVVWLMEKNPAAKFGYSFKRPMTASVNPGFCCSLCGAGFDFGCRCQDW